MTTNHILKVTCSGEAKASPENRLVAELPDYFFLNAPFLSAKRIPKYIPYIIPPESSKSSTAQQRLFHSITAYAASPARIKARPQVVAQMPRSLLVSASSIHLKPWNRRFRPMPHIAITGVSSRNQSIFTTSLAANHSTFSGGVEGKFKRGCAPLRNSLSLSLDGRGSG